MAKGDYLSKRQESIVKGYYDNLETATVQKLSELVSDLYLNEDPRKADRLWESVRAALAKTAANPAQVSKVLAEKNVQGLAQLVTDLNSTKPGAALKPKGPPAGAPTAPPPAAATPPANPAPGASAATGGTGGTGASGGSPPGPNPTSPETLKSALKAFRKRLKMTQLDESSKLGRSPTTTGGRAVVAITPPNQFPRATWDELVQQGKLRRTGGGLYELLEP